VTVVTPPASASPGPNTRPAKAAQVSGALVVADPLLASSVQRVLTHPVAQQRPDLLHFSPSSTDAQSLAYLTPGQGDGGGLPPAAPILMLVLLTSLVGVAVAGALRSSAPPRIRLAVVAGVAALVAPLCAAAVASTPGRHTASAAEPATGKVSYNNASNLLRQRVLHSRHPSQPWGTLLSIERSIAADHAQLVQNENAIATCNALLTNVPVAAAASPSSSPTPDPATLLRPNIVTLVASHLTSLVAAHDSLASQYDTDLQREYDFFVVTAQSPAQQSDIVRAATLTAPDAAQAVAYDLGLVQTQLAQEAAIAAAEAASAAAAQATLPSNFVHKGKLRFHAPVGGVVTQAFGPTDFTLEPPLTYQGVFYPHFHTGLDIANTVDTPVGAAAAGVVILATSSVDASGHLTGYGNYVVIEHGNGFVTLYGHLDKLLVTAGQAVKQGQVIGLLGSTGWSTGPHLHFEIRVNGMFVDPAPYIAEQIRPAA